MQVIKNESTIFIDVDDTLIIPFDVSLDAITRAKKNQINIIDPYDGKNVWRVIHRPNIKLLKNHKARGAHIVVWSQNGYQWAEAVVKTLGLEEYVDQIMSKPRMYVDDLPCQEWMGERMYLKPDHPFGRE